MYMNNKSDIENRPLEFTAAIREALFQTMEQDDSVFLMGLGATDPKGIFGTTSGIKEKFGPARIFDMPISENGMTGIAIGAAINGMRPVMVHQRADFVLMAMDQIINNAAKWRYMYGGQQSVPLTIRMVVGRGWGQGPQHSQNFQAMFAHTPGLKVVTPATSYEAKGLLIASIKDNNPVIFIEHRWISRQVGHVPPQPYELQIGKANIMREGKDVTIVATMDMTLEAMYIAEKLRHKNILVEVVNLATVKPLDKETILHSVAKTGRLLILDSSFVAFGVSAEIAAVVAEHGFSFLKAPIMRLGLPAVPTPTSRALSSYYYPSEAEICMAVGKLLGQDINPAEIGLKDYVNDTPDAHFKGPF